MYLKLCCLVLLALSVSSAPTGSCKVNKCPSPQSKSAKYNYIPGAIYDYTFDSTVNIYLSGNDQQETKTQIQGSAQLFIESDCAYTLQLQRVTVIAPSGSKTTLTQDGRGDSAVDFKKPVRFIMSNDQVSPEICADDDDNDFSLNLKRAIISIIQSTEDQDFETDIYGTCPTISTSTAVGDTTIIRKSRNLNSCSHRESLVSGFVTGLQNENAGIKSSPLLNGDYSIEQRIKNGILESAVVNEAYSFVPFSSGSAGARAKVSTVVKLGGTSAGRVAPISKPTSQTIIFSNPIATPISNSQNLKAAIQRVLASYENHVGPKAATEFTELIRLLRVTKSDDITLFYTEIKRGTVSNNKDLARRIFFDALFRTGTGESVEVLAGLTKELSKDEQRIMYLSLNLVYSMTKNALDKIKRVITDDQPNEGYLTVGSLVAKYCNQHGCSSEEISPILDRFTKNLRNCEFKDRAQQDRIVAILKGLRNTKHLDKKSIDTIIKCSDKDVSRIRVAAIKALASSQGEKTAENKLLSILKDRNEDSELRIEAYSALVANPNGHIANEISELLKDEPVYQVGSYITSHLAALRSSVDASRATAQHHLGQIRSPTKYPFDFRRYSHNMEQSYVVDSLGLGGSMSSNVIYSQESFLPRSSAFDLELQVFGTAFDVYSLEMRQENLQTMLEYFHGPKGFFYSHSSQEILDAVTAIANEYQQSSDASAPKQAQHPGRGKKRNRRGLKEDSAGFAKNVDMGHDIDSDIDLDLSLKLFGSEVVFLSLGQHGLNSPADINRKFRQIFTNTLKGLSNYEKVFEHHSLFIDAELVYPTAIGFPLKLATQGSGVVRLEAKTAIDIPKILKNWTSAELTTKLVPSANIQISGTLTFDASAVASGIQVTGSVHSSTGADVTFKVVNGGTGVDLDVNFPITKQEIFSFDHSIVFVQQDKGQQSVRTPLVFSSEKKEGKGYFDQLEGNTGLKFNYNYVLTVPGNPGIAPFPLNGPYHGSFFIEVDPHYKFQALYNPKSARQHSLLFTFDTPGSQTKRYTSLELAAGQQPQNPLEVYVRATLESPLGNGFIETGTIFDNKIIALYVKQQNSTGEYIGKFGLEKTADSGNHQEYIPILSYKTPGGEQNGIRGYSVEGKIITDKTDSGYKCTLKNIQLVGPKVKPYSVNGEINIGGSYFDSNLKLTHEDKYANLKTNIGFKSQGDDVSANIDLGITSNFDDLLNGRVIFNSENTKTIKSSSFSFIYGPDPNSNKNRIDYSAKYTVNQEQKHIEKQEISASIGAIPASLRYITVTPVGKEDFGLEFEVTYVKYRVGTKVDYKNLDSELNTYTLTGRAYINDVWLDVDSSRKLNANNNKIQLTNKLRTSTGIIAEVTGSTGKSFDENDVDVKLIGKLILAEKQEPYGFEVVIFFTPQKNKVGGKVTAGKKEIAAADILVAKTLTSNNITASGKLTDVFDGNANIFVSDKLGTGTIFVHLLKVDRKLKSEFKYTVKGLVVDVDADLFYDFEKDNTKKLNLNSKTTVDERRLDSKNTITCHSDKYVVNGQFSNSGQLDDGTVNAKVFVQLPNQRQFTGSLVRNVKQLNSDSATGSMKFELSDRDGKKTRSVVFSGVINKGQFKSRIFDVTHSLIYTDFNNGVLEIDTNVKHLPTSSGQKSGAAHVAVRGNLIRQPIELKLEVPLYDHEQFEASFIGKYGKVIAIGGSGKVDGGGRSRPFSYNIQTYFNDLADSSKSKTFEATGIVLKPETDNGVLKVQSTAKLTYNANEVLKYSESLEGNAHGGKFEFALDVPKLEPVKGIAKFSYEENSDSNKASGNFKFEKGANYVQGTGDFSVVGNSNVDAHVSVQTSSPALKNADVTFTATKSSDNRYKSNAKLNADGQVYGYSSEISTSTLSPEIKIDAVYPGKTVNFHAAMQKLADEKYRAEASVKNFGHFNFEGDVEGSFVNKETFYLRSNLNSEILKLRKVFIEIQAKPGSNGRGVTFKSTSEGKNIFDGSADFTIKDERGTTHLEGNGNVKFYNENQKPVKFSFQRTNYDLVRDGEYGLQLVFNGAIGSQNLKADFKVTDRNFNFNTNVCEEKQKCLDLAISSKLGKADFESFQHNINVNIDLRRLGVNQQVSFTTETERKGFEVNHVTVAILKTSDKNSYQYQFKLSPTQASTTVTLPSRVILAESNYKIPKELFGKYDTSLVFYIDKKNRPQHRALIGFTGDLERTQNGVKSAGNIKISYPNVKEFVISGNSEVDYAKKSVNTKMIFDIFQNPDQKIVVSGVWDTKESGNTREYDTNVKLEILSSGIGVDAILKAKSFVSLDKQIANGDISFTIPNTNFVYSAIYQLSPPSSELTISAFNNQFLKVNAETDWKKTSASIAAHLQCISQVVSPIKFSAGVQNGKSASFEFTKGSALKVAGSVQQNKHATVEAVGYGKQLANGKLFLNQAQFFQTEYNLNDNDIRDFTNQFQNQLELEYNQTSAEIQKRGEEFEKYLTERVQKLQYAVPNVKSLQDDLFVESNKIFEEITADPTIQEIVQKLQQFYEKIYAASKEIIQVYYETFTKISEIVQQYFQSAQAAIKEKIIPAIQQLIADIEKIAVNILREAIQYATFLIDRVVTGLKTFDTDLGQTGKLLGDFFKNLSVAVKKFYDVLSKDVTDLVSLIVSNIKEYPGWDRIKAAYNEFKNQHNLIEENLAILRDVMSIVKDILPTKESSVFIERLYGYVESKLLERPVNDAEQLKLIYESFVEAIKSLALFVKGIVSDSSAVGTTPSAVFSPLPISFDYFKSVPVISSVKVSIWNYLKSESFPSPRQLFHDFRPYGFKIENAIPPFAMRAILSDGQHIFTFDGKHLTFPGDSSYILSQDFVHNNFSVIATLKQGHLKSIALIDKSGQVEVDNQGQVKYNGQASDLPIHDKDIHAWREYYSVTLLSYYGVEVFCTIDLRTCHVKVNGYYHGRVRGILGVGNGEPYDDFTLPKSTIASNYADFGNAYRVGKGNYQVPFVDHSHHHAHREESCTATFAGESSLQACFFFIDPANFREACDHAVSTATDKADALCNIAQSYVSACRRETIFVEVPANCVKCEGKDVGAHSAVVVPNKKADIVFVVDTSDPALLHNVTDNLVIDLKNQLKARAIPDVNIAIIGYNKAQKYPSIYTENGKFNIVSKKIISSLNTEGPALIDHIVTSHRDIDAVIRIAEEALYDLREEAGQSTDALAFTLAYKYPFRADAVKTIFAIRNDRLENQYESAARYLTAYAAGLHANRYGIGVHMLAPVKDLVHVPAKNSPSQLIFGFNKNTAIGFTTEGKKKGITNNAELLRNIKFEEDLGIEIVQEFGGFVYNLDAYSQLKPPQRKIFFQNVASTLADHLSRQELTTDCVCTIRHGMFGEEVCHVESRKVLPPKKVSAQRG